MSLSRTASQNKNHCFHFFSCIKQQKKKNEQQVHHNLTYPMDKTKGRETEEASDVESMILSMNEQRFDETDPDNALANLKRDQQPRDAILAAFHYAKTFFKPNNNSKTYEKFDKELEKSSNDLAAIKIIKKLLNKTPHLWKNKPSSILSFHNGDYSSLYGDVATFSNMFLIALRHTSLLTYRSIINDLYLLPKCKTAFQNGDKLTVFRADNRDEADIFANGFTPWAATNLPAVNKINYATDHGQVGISTSTSETICRDWGMSRGHIYVIKLPKDHHLLGIPFAKEYENEINWMDAIPGRYVKECRYYSGLFLDTYKASKNPYYQKNVIESPKITRGCY